jgi:hypothetical protein
VRSSPIDVRLLGNGNHYVSLLVPFSDVHVGLDDLLQGIGPVDDSPDLPGLDEFLKEVKVLETPTFCPLWMSAL